MYVKNGSWYFLNFELGLIDSVPFSYLSNKEEMIYYFPDDHLFENLLDWKQSTFSPRQAASLLLLPIAQLPVFH